MGLFSAIGSFISGIFKPASDLIDNLHTSDEEKLELRNKFAEIQEKAQAKMVELEMHRLDAISKVEVAEAASSHWLRANWRPIVSLALVSLIIADSFALVVLSDRVLGLSEIFLGTYAGGRSLEKMASVVKFGGRK